MPALQARLLPAPLRPWKPLKAVAIATMASTATSTISTPSPGLLRRSLAHAYPGSTFIAARSRMVVINDMTDSTIIVISPRSSWAVSVGPQAVAL